MGFPIATWRETALKWAAAKLNGAVQALQPVRPSATATGVAGYQVADYLDQYGRRTRQDQLGPASLWDTLVARAANASDLTRLGQAARGRGLYCHAAALWTTAAELGSTGAARQLITHLRQVSPGDTIRAAHWAVSHASLDNPGAVAWLLRALRAAGANDAVTALATRAAGHASLDNPGAVAWLLRALREAGASDAVATLLARDPAGHARLDDPRAVARACWRGAAATAGASADAVTDPGRTADPAGRHASLDDPTVVAELLRCAARGRGQQRGHRPGRPGPPATPASTTRGPSPGCCGRCARPGPATRSLPCWPATPPATPASTTRGPSPGCCGRCARPGPATRSPPCWPATPPATPASTTRGPSPGCCEALRAAGASDAVTALATRATNAGMFHLFLEVHPDEASSYIFGRGPDGAPSQSWNWLEPAS